MTELTISFPEKLKAEIESHPEINWTEVFRKAAKKLLDRVELIELMEENLGNSEFTEKDALELGNLVKEKRLEYLKSKGLL